MPLTVKNPLPNPVIYGRRGEENIVWDASGDPAGGDVQEVSDEFASRADFLKSVSRGVLQVISADDEALLARLRSKTNTDTEQYADSEDRTSEDAYKAFSRVPDRSIVSLTCVGPAQRGTGKCDTVVMVAPAFAKEFPPLCPPHGPLLSEFERDAAGEWARKSGASAAS